jgi:hypothetical protein
MKTTLYRQPLCNLKDSKRSIRGHLKLQHGIRASLNLTIKASD